MKTILLSVFSLLWKNGVNIFLKILYNLKHKVSLKNTFKLFITCLKVAFNKCNLHKKLFKNYHKKQDSKLCSLGVFFVSGQCGKFQNTANTPSFII